jgi:cytochrome c oxidase accessory protein FixG
MSAESNTNGGEAVEVVSLYERWKKIQSLWVKGPFQTARRVCLVLLLLVFYAGPWITWGGGPALWLDVPNRKFIIFGATFWPQEFVLLSILLIIAAFTLFVFTIVAGRLWCGFACPQTVWTLCYVWIEKLVEGDRSQRIFLDRSRWSGSKLRKKSLKYALWGLLALSISVTFVGYFTPIRELAPRIATLELGTWEQFFILFVAGASFLMQGVLREQVCLHMCPYARFQSVMFDHDTLIVSYDAERGDPRGSRRRGSDPAEQGLGSCIDCKVCVHACPTGIDIRDGLQYECIGCAACVDACNGIMAKMGYEPNLIRFSSQHEDEHQRSVRIRPRLVGYAAVLTTMIVAFSAVIATRVPLELDVIRDRNRLYREHWDGTVENAYTLRIMNMEQRDRVYRVRWDADIETRLTGKELVEVSAGQQRSLPFSLFTSDAEGGEPNVDVRFTIETVDDPSYSVTEVSRFLRPDRSG